MIIRILHPQFHVRILPRAHAEKPRRHEPVADAGDARRDGVVGRGEERGDRGGEEGGAGCDFEDDVGGGVAGAPEDCVGGVAGGEMLWSRRAEGAVEEAGWIRRV